MKGKRNNAPAKVLNREALRDYEILDKIEAGIELRGTEVKSIRAANASLKGSYARIQNKELYLLNMNISPYEQGNINNHDPVRPRKLLVHRKELLRLRAAEEQKGLTLVPISVYMKGKYVKVELGTGRGRKHHDKREAVKRKTADREAARAVARSTRR